MKVTIGVPTLNSQNRLAECLDCILQQTHEDLEVIVSNNASSDGTRDLCEQYAAADPRIKVHHQATRLCMRDNFRFVLDKATASLFHWRADDDLSDLDYIEKMHALASSGRGHGAVILAGGAVRLDRIHGDKVRTDSRPQCPTIDIEDIVNFIQNHLLNKRDFNAVHWFNGVWHADQLRGIVERTWEVYDSENLWGTDYVTVLPGLLSRRVKFDDSATFHKRLIHADRAHHPARETMSYDILHERLRLLKIASSLYKDEVRSAGLPHDATHELLRMSDMFARRASAWRLRKYVQWGLRLMYYKSLKRLTLS